MERRSSPRDLPAEQVILGGVGYEFIDVPLDGADDYGWREDGLITFSRGFGLVQAG